MREGNQLNCGKENVKLHPKSESKEICMDMCTLGDHGVGSKALYMERNWNRGYYNAKI